jgi:hypothetical protein
MRLAPGLDTRPRGQVDARVQHSTSLWARRRSREIRRSRSFHGATRPEYPLADRSSECISTEIDGTAPSVGRRKTGRLITRRVPGKTPIVLRLVSELTIMPLRLTSMPNETRQIHAMYLCVILLSYIFTIHETWMRHMPSTMKQQTLRPSDVVVCCQLTVTPEAPFQALSYSIGMSVGECHNAVQRLVLASLLNPVSRRPVTELLVRFLVHGVPHSFAAQVGPAVVGVPSAIVAPVLAGRVSAPDSYVWPHLDGATRGLALTPLFPRAAELPGRNQPLYEILSSIDVLRVGQAREKKLAEELLRERLMGGSA